MSRFYQRYLSGLKKDTEGSLLGSESRSTAKPLDPTAMAKSHAPTKAPANTTSATSTTSTGPARRVQIYNASDAFSPTDNKHLAVFAKPESAKAFLRQALSKHYLFEALSDEDMNRIVDCMRPHFTSLNELIIKQGDTGDLFYCLEAGTAVATVDAKEVLTYQPGGCFGELALLYNSPRAASVIARTACKLWTLDLKTFRHILATTSSSIMVRRCEFLKKCTFLDGLSNEQIGKLAGALEESQYEDGQRIIRQGEIGNSFYIIEEGRVRCSQVKASGREVDLITLKVGDYFGEMALMLNETRHANCSAVGKVKCLSLDKNKFYMLLGSVQELLAKRMRIRILQSVPLLSRLSESKLAKLSSVMRVQAFNDGTYIIRQGEEGSRFYIINEGEVICTRSLGGGKEEELIRLSAMEFFGERALITNEVRKANVIAKGHVECLVLERSSFQSLLTDVQDDLVNEMSRRENATTSVDREKEIQAAKEAAEQEMLMKLRTTYRFDELRVMRTIGTGTFGRVKVVQHVGSGQVYALKCMNKAEVVASSQEKNIMTEKNLLFECAACPFILKLMQTFNHPNQILMLMEFVQGGEMWSYIYEKTDSVARCQQGGFEMSAVKFYSANVILAFHYMHGRGIGFRDLKPENLLMDEHGYIKVIDFGFAKKFPYFSNDQRLDKTYTLCGTPEYLAPEIVMSKGHDLSVDYWALGCLIYEFFLARTPFQADYTAKIFQNIVASEKNLTFPPKMDPLHVALIKKLLSVNPAFRLGNLSGGVDDIIRDPFFATVDWEAIRNRTAKAPYTPPIHNPLDSSNFDEYDEENDIPEYSGNQALFQNF